MQATLFTLCFSLLLSLAPAQHSALFDPLNLTDYIEPQGPPPFQTYTAIFYNGKPLLKGGDTGEPLVIAPKEGEVFGRITVQTWDQDPASVQPGERVGFRVAIQDYATKTLWMYSPETLYELDLREVRDRCKPSDTIFIMVVDKQYRLPRFRVLMMDGC